MGDFNEFAIFFFRGPLAKQRIDAPNLGLISPPLSGDRSDAWRAIDFMSRAGVAFFFHNAALKGLPEEYGPPLKSRLFLTIDSAAARSRSSASLVTHAFKSGDIGPNLIRQYEPTRHAPGISRFVLSRFPLNSISRLTRPPAMQKARWESPHISLTKICILPAVTGGIYDYLRGGRRH